MFSYRFEESADQTLMIVVEGKLDTPAAEELQQEVERYKGRGFEKIVFETSKLSYMASSGIRVIFFAFKYLGNNPQMEIIGASGLVAQILKMSGMSKFVTTAE